MNRFSLRALTAAVPALILSIAAPISAAEGWTEDFDKAKETAAKDGKDLLIDFTGSDWCGWCIKLQKEVFTKDGFKSTAPKNFVLVELDFPQQKEQSKELKERNAKLQEEFGIEGFPTIILADAKRRPRRRLHQSQIRRRPRKSQAHRRCPRETRRRRRHQILQGRNRRGHRSR
jgi:thioredoxin-related protein